MQRRAITISGIVQGVGFRPFLFRLAARFHLSGYARNDGGHVTVEVEGTAEALERFAAALTAETPALARIDAISSRLVPILWTSGFEIRESGSNAGHDVFVSPDVATCADCLRELLDPADRRFRYPFINCTNCGPRLTIVTGAPYDRRRTTMASFVMCDSCRAEYENPLDRRFHAQPIACPACGPQLRLADESGEPLAGHDALGDFAAALVNGQIGALKGVGGFHLVCDATNDVTVRRLRSRKHREEKPFAIMVLDAEVVSAVCEISAEEEALLRSRGAPIVLLTRRNAAGVAAAVAPGNRHLGVMLPYTPVHHLLLRAVDQRPLVMTSGNRSDEPIARDNEEALEQLRGIADVFLLHNRGIHVRCDDSVTRIVGHKELPIRRSRGYAPQPITLPFEVLSPILAVGGQLKGTFALARETHAFLSHHLGDLDHHQAFRAFQSDVSLYEKLFRLQPACIAHDVHADYASTRFAHETGLPLIAVQHHHAHVASCMAENGLTSQVIGVSFDGLGLGSDGAVWGGEFLVGGYGGFRRAAHLRYVGMPGGDQATREPWRMALAHRRDAEIECPELSARSPGAEFRVVDQMLARQFNTPMTSSMGRLFDAVASLIGVRDRVSYEGQAAMELEWLATETAKGGSYPFALTHSEHAGPIILDTRPLIQEIVAEIAKKVDAKVIARRFHSTVSEMITEVCREVRQETGLTSAVFSGGVFMNALLTTEATARLEGDGFTVYRHRLVPPNDAGLSLGQVAIAAARLRTDATSPTLT